jgi:ribonuclease PH
MRQDGRAVDELRETRITPNFLQLAHGSCLIEVGLTRVLCTAMVDENVPRWMQHKGSGWVTAEYAMLPGSTPTRTRRGVTRGKPDGRTVEIQRLIGRSMRTIVDLDKLGPRQIFLDCDVLQADGGTRTASITGAFVALVLALNKLKKEATIRQVPLLDTVSAVSVGIVHGQAVLDLPYPEDSKAATDMNVVMTGTGGLIEVQGTAEKAPFSRAELGTLLDLATVGCTRQRELQLAALDGYDLGSKVIR